MTTQRPTDDIEIHYTGEGGAAVYVNGQRFRDAGDAYLREEWVFDMLGVKQVTDDAFMRGQDRWEGAARTLSDVELYRIGREERRQRAECLKAEAQRMLAEAKELMEP